MARKQQKKPSTASAAGKGNSDLAQLEQVFELMGRHGVAELEWETENVRLHVKTPAACVGNGVQMIAAPQASYAPAPAAPRSAGSPGEPSPAATPAPGALAGNQKQINSPFVGTFYRSASPTAEAYVKEGKTVKRGDVLCIIEAMKLMNEIESEFNGKIVQVLVENGQPVEFGEPLFVIEV